ncbi:MAG: hypothetical protein AAGA20_07970 [Planctomycetota bacterium]
MRDLHRSALGRSMALSATLVVAAATASAQVEAPTFFNLSYVHDTGAIPAPTQAGARDLEVVSTFTVEQAGAEWMRIYFEDVLLAGDLLSGTGGELRLISLFDGAVQRMDVVEVERWGNSTAYFNGDSVVVEVWARPGTGDSRVVVGSIDVGYASMATESICGPSDDRIPSNDPRSGRLLPVGCTAWLINDCAGCFLTAGHCTGNISVVQFNVPPSNSNGSIQNPPPSDQYPVDQISLQSNGGQGVGNDWAYFGTFANGTTGMTASQVQGPGFTLVTPPSVGSANIRITGYGTDNTPPERNQVQQTNAGALVTNSGTVVQYTADTTGGNSGSPVIWDQMDQAVGIHTHGGCGSSGGQNSGTSMVHPALQAALANPEGICGAGINVETPPSLIERAMPTNIEARALGPIVPGTMTLHWRADSAAMFQSVAMVPVSAGVFSGTLPPFECSETPEFFVSAQSVDCGQVFSPEAGASGPYTADVGALDVAFADDFQSDSGWQTTNLGASSGQWERGVPVNDPGWQYDPSSDGDGSGSCYLTQNQSGNTDVDDGTVRLISPSISITNAASRLDYQYYLALTNQEAEDALVVEVSVNGGASWTQLRRHDVSTGPSWANVTISSQELAQAGVAPGGTMQVRFTANDGNPQSIVEAGVDGFAVGDVVCDPFAIGLPECAPAAPNSSSLPATLRAQGSVDVSDDDVLLIAESLPTSTVGYFLASRDSGLVVSPGGSAGVLCLGGSIGRYAGNVLSSGASGSFQFRIALANLPQPSGSVAAMAGETWRFQAWFRDFALVSTSNFTHALAITFE